ncbi:MAG: restriction endonuclease subunit S [Bryobacteraceae bacterium]|nr:restriction endonuclease subunit S [Bryobacteraceae bacterium]
MAGEWRSQRFADMAVLVRDTVHPSDAARLPYIGLEHIEEGTLRLAETGIAEDATSLKARFSAGDILFGKLRPYFRKVIRAPFDGICSTDIWVVRPQPGVDAGFLFYLMASNLFLEPVVRASEGTKMPRAKWEYATSLVLPFPPLSEQRAIAHILGTLDDKIELNRRMSETLEAMARALFKSWFVDFDPVRAKMEGRWQRGQSLPGLPAHLYDLFPDRLVDSELGEIPEGWHVAAVGDCVRCVKGTSYKSEHLQDSDTALVTLKSFARGGGYRPNGLKGYTGDFKPEQVVHPGELVVACTDVTQAAEVIGKPALVQSSEKHTTLVASLDVLVVRPASDLVSVPFLYCLFRGEEFSDHTYAHSTGTTVLHLSKDAVPSFRFPLPTTEVAKAFARFAAPLFQRIDEAERESRTLAALRDALLPKLISGELRVKDAERFLQERGL